MVFDSSECIFHMTYLLNISKSFHFSLKFGETILNFFHSRLAVKFPVKLSQNLPSAENHRDMLILSIKGPFIILPETCVVVVHQYNEASAFRLDQDVTEYLL